MAEFIGKGNLGEQANSNIAQNRGPDRFDTVRPEVPPNRHAESTFPPHERPIRRLDKAAIHKAIVLDELRRGLWDPVALEITARSDAHERSCGNAPDNRVWFGDRPKSYCQVDPIFHHISHEVRENEIHLEAGIERQ